MNKLRQGFTLIELMIVVAIIGILAAIAIPKFADLINKSKEGATKGSLSSVRSALQVYYADSEGLFPTDSLASLTLNAKYLAEMPLAKTPGTGHIDSRGVKPNAISDEPGWAYGNTPSNVAYYGSFFVNCTHEDIKGRENTAVTTPWWSAF